MVGIAVLLKQVPDTTARISVSGGRVDESAITSWVTSPYDEYALEVAIQHKETSGASITAITLGPPRADKVLKDAAALGVENLVRVWDDAWESLDSNQVQSALASTLESVGADWIYCGKQSADRNQGSTGPGVAERLGMACIVEISDWDVTGAQPSFTRATSSGNERLAPTPPIVLTFTKTETELRRPNVRGIMAAKKANIEVVSADIGDAQVQVVAHNPPAQKPEGRKFEGAESVPEVVGLLRDEAKVI